ncbi:MAG TPA: TonB family protein [Blastocatellia bacterium]|jgi:TonB family protein
MRHKLNVFLPVLFVIVAGAHSSQAQTNPGSSDKNHYQSSVVSVISYGKDGSVLARGTGFFVSASGDVMTDKDLLPDGTSRTEIKTSDGKSFPVARVNIDQESGLALLSVNVPQGFARPLRYSTSSVAGEQVVIVTAGAESEHKLTETSISAVKDSPRLKLIQVAASTAAESYGSPVINKKGEFIGVIISQEETGGALNAISGFRVARIYPPLLGLPLEGAASASKDSKSDAVPVTGIVLQGQALTRIAPGYPLFAKNAHISGTILVEVTVDEEGNVISARAIKANIRRPRNITDEEAKGYGADLQRASIDAARQWKFTPTKLGGKPVKVIGVITFNFSL